MYIPDTHAVIRGLTSVAAAVSSFTGAASLKNDPNHKFIAPTSGAVRGPCPALNVLANYGFLDRSGKEISFKQFNSAIQTVYGVDAVLTDGLVGGGWLAAGNKDLTIDLDKLSKHTGIHIEHDGSFTRANAPLSQSQSAPLEISKPILNQVLALGGSKGFTLDTFAQARVMREGDKPLDSLHAKVAQGESAMLWHLFRDRKSNVVPVSSLRTFLESEKLPDSYVKPEKLTFPVLNGIVTDIAKRMAAIREKGGSKGVKATTSETKAAGKSAAKKK